MSVIGTPTHKIAKFLVPILCCLTFVECLNKSEFKELLPLVAKEFYFTFDEFWYKQIDGTAMGSPLGPTLANTFLCRYEKSGHKMSLGIQTGLL